MQFLNALKKPAWLVAVVCFSLSTFCTLLNYAGAFGGGFMPVVGNLIAMLLSLAILGGLLFFLVTRNDETFKYFFFIYFAYWILRSIYSGLSAADFAVNGVAGYAVAWRIFEFLAALGLIGVLVLFVLGKLLKKDSFKPLALIVMLATSAFFLIVMILYIVVIAKGNWGWGNYFDAFNTFFLPLGMTFAYIYLNGDALTAAASFGAKKAPAEEKAEETTEETPIEETEETTDEVDAPAEESSENE